MTHEPLADADINAMEREYQEFIDSGVWGMGDGTNVPRLIAEVRRLRTRNTELEGRQDWTGHDVYDAVMRIRAVSESNGPTATVSVDDLRKLFGAADGVADSYSRLLEHTTGLTKPTTDPRAAITLADDLENERFREYLKDELAALRDSSPSDDAALERALGDIAERRFPESGDYELAGTHEYDARHAYPNRERWLANRAQAVLGKEETSW